MEYTVTTSANATFEIVEHINDTKPEAMTVDEWLNYQADKYDTMLFA